MFAGLDSKDGTTLLICDECKKNSDEVWISSVHHLCLECWKEKNSVWEVEE